MIKKNGRPITGSIPQMNSRPPVLTNANNSSRDAQRMVSGPPAPFANPNNAKNTPAPSNRNVVNLGGLPAKTLLGSNTGGYQIDRSASIHNGTQTTDDMMAAVGYSPKATKSNDPLRSGRSRKG